MSPPSSLAGQTAVVSGGTRGIGRACVLDLLRQGAAVHATYVANEEAADALREEAQEFDGQLTLHRFDVADHAAVEAFWAGLGESVEGGVQMLVHSSGVRRDALLAMMSPEDWGRVIETNLTGSYAMCKHAVLHMLRQRYGRIVLITSPAGLHGFQGQGNYGASKAGQIGLMRSLMREVAKKKITVNCVSPGFIATDLIADLPDGLREEYRKSVPVQRFGEADEVAYAVRSLLMPEAAYITGATLEVTGGL